jgi:hypothetical protein
MNALEMDYRFEPRDPSRRIKGLIIVIALHAIMGYALVSGMARKGLNFIKKPLEAVVIQEVVIPPPPPDAPVATGPKRATMGLACPAQVPPEMPRKALQDGIEGVVKAALMQYKCVTHESDVIAVQEFNFKLD